ncbi:MAG: Asp-tRNA(Asn)/Glu-tRNA(Gln) amidotransferase subunit GatC [Eubacterium sp.]|nr:Asp-tRNA(Asn)/Glu-tRNA(Gln) amidotransferase subunit GatC [Eubacterium sp.]
MEITKKRITRLEELAHITLTDAERAAVADELTALLSYMALLDTLDTADTAEATHLFGIHNVLRSDTVKPSLLREQVLQNTVSEDGCFAVPQTVEEG